MLKKTQALLTCGSPDPSLPPSVLSHVDMSVEEREELLKQIAGLKEEIASMKSSSLLGEHQPKDIVRE